MEKRGYVPWVDMVKGVCIMAVVALHVNYAMPFSSTLEVRSLAGNSWHMPVFFIVAGFFMTPQRLTDVKGLIKSKFSSLYLRLLCFYIPLLLLHNTFVNTGFYNTATLYSGKQMTLLTATEYAQKLAEVLLFMGREPYASPLWFVYVLILAFAGLALTACVARRLCGGTGRRWEAGMAVALVTLASISYFLTNHYDITIPRISNVFPAMWLIFLGMTLRGRLGMTFRSGGMAALAAVVLVGTCLCNSEKCMMTNDYDDVAQLTVMGFSALYVLAFLAQRAEHTALGRMIAYIGNKSFYVMALHLISISICCRAANGIMGIGTDYGILGGEACGFAAFAALTAAGIALPTALAWVVDSVKALVKRDTKA